MREKQESRVGEESNGVREDTQSSGLAFFPPLSFTLELLSTYIHAFIVFFYLVLLFPLDFCKKGSLKEFSDLRAHQLLDNWSHRKSPYCNGD